MSLSRRKSRMVEISSSGSGEGLTGAHAPRVRVGGYSTSEGPRPASQRACARSSRSSLPSVAAPERGDRRLVVRRPVLTRRAEQRAMPRSDPALGSERCPARDVARVLRLPGGRLRADEAVARERGLLGRLEGVATDLAGLAEQHAARAPHLLSLVDQAVLPERRLEVHEHATGLAMAG